MLKNLIGAMAFGALAAGMLLGAQTAQACASCSGCSDCPSGKSRCSSAISGSGNDAICGYWCCTTGTGCGTLEHISGGVETGVYRATCANGDVTSDPDIE